MPTFARFRISIHETKWNRPSKICGRQLLKFQGVWSALAFLKVSSTNFTWPVLEYFVPYVTQSFLRTGTLFSHCFTTQFGLNLSFSN